MPPRRVFKLRHYAPRKLDVVDPLAAKPNPWTSKAEVNSGVPKTYWYVGKAPRERFFAGFVEHRFNGALRLYDIRKDPLQVVGDGNWQALLAQRGFDGFHNGGVAAVFRAIKVT